MTEHAMDKLVNAIYDAVQVGQRWRAPDAVEGMLPCVTDEGTVCLIETGREGAELAERLMSVQYEHWRVYAGIQVCIDGRDRACMFLQGDDKGLVDKLALSDKLARALELKRRCPRPEVR